nr:MAG TPA: hypothetical protein [Caudoviricetes sp.]
MGPVPRLGPPRTVPSFAKKSHAFCKKYVDRLIPCLNSLFRARSPGPLPDRKGPGDLPRPCLYFSFF